MIVLSFLLNTFKLIFKLPVLLCLGIVYSIVGIIRGIYSIFHAFYWVFLALAFVTCLVWHWISYCACDSQCNCIINV
ncbi:hypothetical protein DW667_10330 [Coprococcus sp. AM25-15LB]|uniref:Uncharacterized protein n=1 Tax=Faecalimonas umbilicata TaxID=1912855 RepID=A0A4R3JN27_9FIRM|nr:hypothetical protein [Faecalimonas umbilicata]RGC74560.1 hypothetical protein DW667_10330 [Coprococcus sp. AM25-15LB]RJW07093.1 hypothetical protein DW686_09795 [Coprococcus sp. AM25-4LB]TCS67878.1 hypothetical protein EDD74_11314 [Faecalimonas umbilicata]GBU05865.1 hypothetical protein FAEUMB_24060 [Faecalimonas umbilicata]